MIEAKTDLVEQFRNEKCYIRGWTVAIESSCFEILLI